MKVAILGYGEQNKTAYEYWNSQGNDITICDLNETVDLPKDCQSRLGENYIKGLEEFDLIVRSPSVHPLDIVAANSKAILSKVTSVTNEFLRVCPTKNIIGVTGTKGKGTTSTLISLMLEKAGKKVFFGGNIGTPPLDLLKLGIQPDDWVVLELANFQLIDLKQSPRIGVCLMVVPEHLDWHPTFNEYLEAKKQLFVHQGADDIAIYFALNDYSKQIAEVSQGSRIPYYALPGAVVDNGSIVIDNQVVCSTSALKLRGRHNWQNACAAVTAVRQVTKDISAMHSVLTTFSGLEHRLELVREVNEVSYFDDSFGTTPETAIVAIESFNQPIVLILGGSDKHASYKDLALTVRKHNIRAVVVIGDTAPAIADCLKKTGYSAIYEGGTTMSDIVGKASSLAEAGDVVLLSTGCASFGLFENYKDRGEQFKKAVLELV